MSRYFCLSAFTFAGLALVLSGCGEPVGKVAGKVTYKGTPVVNGSVSFNLKGKGVAQDAKVDASGGYTMKDVLPAGTYHVVYVPPTPEPQDPSKGPPAPIVSVVPKKYEDLTNTDLSVQVKSGMNDVPIDFKD